MSRVPEAELSTTIVMSAHGKTSVLPDAALTEIEKVSEAAAYAGAAETAEITGTAHTA